MTDHHPHHHLDEEQLATLLAALPPAPEGWVQAAQELPFVRPMLDEIVARAEADAAFRAALIQDLEAALDQTGYERDPSLLEALERELERRLGQEGDER
jgi:hypothetical protein